MKHPALTQALAIVLVVLSLTMGAAGVLGLRSAADDARGVLASAERLRQRAENYRTLAALLDGTVSYAEQNAALEERVSQHDRDSAKHRSELSLFTATKYGINMGTDAIDEADAQFAAVRAQFDRALPVFEKGLGELNALLASLTEVCGAADGIVQSADQHLVYAQSLTASLDSGEELTAAQAAEGYGELLLILDETQSARDTLQALRPALDTIAAFDPASVTAMTAAASGLMSSLSAFGSVPVESYAEFDVSVPYDMDELVRMQQSFSAYWTQAQALLDALDAASPALGQELERVTGMNEAALREELRREQDAFAARGDEPLNPAETALLRAAYSANSEEIHTRLSEAEAAIGPLKSSLAELGGQLGEAQTQLTALSSLLATAKQGIQTGADALYQARALIWWQMGQQREKEAALSEEKAALDEESAALLLLTDEAEAQKELESRLRSARASLMNVDAVRALANEGREPDEAALLHASRREGGSLQTCERRQRACFLMLAGALGGLLALPGAFSGRNSRLLLTPPLLLCLAAALSAEAMLRGMGRGDSYSCLAAALFAGLQLLVSLPGEKRIHAAKGT